MIAVLTCYFLLALHRVDRTATSTRDSAGPSSASLGLHFAAGAESQGSPTRSWGRARTAALPAFIASMGEQVYTGPHFGDVMDGTGWDEDEDEVGAEDRTRGADDSRPEEGAYEDCLLAASSHLVETPCDVTGTKAEA